MRLLWPLLACFFSLVLISCAKRAPEMSYDYAAEESYYAADGVADYAEAESTAAYSRSAAAPGAPMRAQKASGGSPPPRAPSSSNASSPPPSEPADAAPEQTAAPAKRMVFYSGYARMRATRPEDLVADVVALAEAQGGFVEQRSLRHVTVRVPVETFLEFYAEVLGLDDVLNKSLTAQDITEAYSAVELRLRTAEATRSRLQELLAQAETEEEKLELLRQIRRLTEEIDLVEAQLRTLSSLAATSRMTVEAVPRDAFSESAPNQLLDGMTWIADLNPFTNAVTGGGKRLKLEAPEGFVPLDVRRRFEAESADGATLHSARLDNEPYGDAAFWAESVKGHFGQEFVAAAPTQVGEWTTLRLEQAGVPEPYAWVIAVRTRGRTLDLVEVFYPSPEQEARYGASIEAMLAGQDAVAMTPEVR